MSDLPKITALMEISPPSAERRFYTNEESHSFIPVCDLCYLFFKFFYLVSHLQPSARASQLRPQCHHQSPDPRFQAAVPRQQSHGGLWGRGGHKGHQRSDEDDDVGHFTMIRLGGICQMGF